jgi:Tol biopolymer transport system component
MYRTFRERQFRKRASALVLLGLLLGRTGGAVADKEIAGIVGFSKQHDGSLLWYDSAGHLLVVESGQITDPLAHMTAFAKPPQASYPSLSPDGKQVAFVQEETSLKSKSGQTQAIWITDLEKGTPKKLAVLPWVNALSWSPTGDRLAFISEGLKILTLSNGHITFVTPEKSYYKIPSWSPDGNQIVYECATGTDEHQVFHVCVADLVGGEIKIIAEGESPSWSPKGDQIAYIDSKAQVYFSMSPTGANKHLLVNTGYAASKGTPVLGAWLVWAPDQQSAVYNGYYDGGVEAISTDLVTGKKTVVKRLGYFVAVDWRP